RWTFDGLAPAGFRVLRRDLSASGTYAVTISHDAVAHSLIENAAGATVEIVEGHTLALGG
ncbi:MAG TPA: hypothetical protein VK561_10650, partial [Bradyrhizobium sp.]|nr:hypothetical protein [Bradyrhizobium sp.]